MTARLRIAALLAVGCLGMGTAATAVASSVRTTTSTVSPKVQRTVGFNGHASYQFRAPRGRHIVGASARISGGTAGAVRITSRVVSRDRTRYTVDLIFPGQQGKPGRLIVTLRTAG